MFPELPLLFWLRWVLLVLAFTPLEVNVWERTTSVSGFTPICWVFIAIEFPLVCCIGSALDFLPFRRVFGAFGFSLDHCEDRACGPLVTLFLLVLAETKFWGEHYDLWWCWSFVCWDLLVLRLLDYPGWALGFWGAREFTHYVKCINVTSIRSMVALTASTFFSTYVSC